MGSFRETRLWRDSLGAANLTGSREDWRRRLEAVFEGMRRQAVPLSREIARDLPTFTVHDETHIDALWEIAEIVGGETLTLNPVEAFLFGGAAICHDLAMSIASYPDGRQEIRKLPIYTQGAALLYPTIEIDELTEEQRERIDEWAIRENHAPQAQRLARQKWVNPKDGSEYTLIEDGQFRTFFSHRIGQFAESHWWPLDRVAKQLSGSPGPPGGMPAEWTVDEFKIAAILRAADAAHIDHRRAPSFLFTLKRLSGLSADHWLFQNLLETPRVFGNRLTYTASRPFQVNEAEAWWLCYDTVNMIDAELSAIDRHFDDHKSVFRFDARSVRGASNPEELERCIRVDGWIPVDARPSIGDITSLIDRLGGAQLYGNSPLVPLRELLQNALDATAALKLDSPELGAIAAISCILAKSGDGSAELTVMDNGIGMTRATIIGSLLDFGSSLWRSELLRREFPRLLERRFKSIGRFGIGFFSVFMWADEVKVTTRVHNTPREQTLALEFRNGLRDRPILRNAANTESRDVGGTNVQLHLKNPDILREDADRDLRYRRPPTLNELVKRILPLPNIAVAVDEYGDKSRIEPIQWQTVSAKKLLQSVLPDSAVFVSRGAESLSDIIEDGTVVGRATFYPGYLANEFMATVVGPGGFRVGHVQGCIGVFSGDASNVARDRAVVSASGSAIRDWANTQAARLVTILVPEEQMDVAEHVASVGGDVGDLCVGRTSDGILNVGQIAEWALEREYVLIANGGIYNDREGDPTILRTNVVWLDYSSYSFRQSLGWSRDRQLLELPDNDVLLASVATAIIMRWRSAGFIDATSRAIDSFIVIAHYEASGVWFEEGAAVVLLRDPSVRIPEND